MTQENLEIVLNRANCCIAEKSLQLSKLWSIGSKCYKQELRDLKVLNDSVDTLLNNAFTQNSIFTVQTTCEAYNTYLATILPINYKYGAYYYLSNGEILKYFIEADGIKTISVLINELLITNNLQDQYTTSSCVDGNIIQTISAPCNVLRVSNIIINNLNVVVSELTSNNIQSGICQGCLTEEQINTLIEQVMKICSICNCELDNL